MHYIPSFKKFQIAVPDLLVVAVCIVSFIFSVIESKLNTDAHHWGLMYANAIDLVRGSIPFKEIFIQYGILTTIIQGFSLVIFGNKAISVGIITGLFYSCSLYISYLLWQKIISKNRASFSTILMFLLQGYIVYPWSNYFSYTFLLICLLLLSNGRSKNSRILVYCVAGIFFALNVLSRQTAFGPTIVPIYLYFLLELVESSKEERKTFIKKIVLFHLGVMAIFAIFFVYLYHTSSLQDWYLQSFTILSFYEDSSGGVKNLIFGFLQAMFISPILTFDIRTIIYLLNFCNSIFWIQAILAKVFRKNLPVTDREKVIFLLASISLFGYAQALYKLSVFRLQNSSSIGLGLLTLSGFEITSKLLKWQRYIILGIICAMSVYLSGTLGGLKFSSVYYNWPKDLFSGRLQQPENIDIFQGKLFNTRVKSYYESLVKEIDSYKSSVPYIINLTRDSYILYLSNNFEKVQSSPFYVRELNDMILPDEQQKIDNLIAREDAIYITHLRKIEDFRSIPSNYCIVYQAQKPREVPFMRKYISLVVPRKIAKECLTINIESSKDKGV
ncbi:MULTISPECIES: glycosyltransferase family 39 protein [unclassified Microcystis]|jgi:hypothetical protein|uniref:glycosyltransferase family 39 protein n=1 Tax=unclassified Microcystis TaxID=2643300 RepID=UPI0025860DED|nr:MULTISPECIES: glycosyltransferase family 39 protein [unclassified Microcystis]